MVVILCLIGAVFAFLAGAQGGELSEQWWETLNASVLPFLSLAVAFFIFAAVASVSPKPLSSSWRFESLMLGATALFGFSVLFAATHPEKIDTELLSLMLAQGATSFILLVLFFILKGDKFWKLAIPAILFFVVGAGFFGYAFLG